MTDFTSIVRAARPWLALGLACSALAACASAPDAGGDMASSAFDYAPARDTRMETRHGYDLGDGEGWSGRLAYEDVGGALRVAMDLRPAGGERVAAELDIGMPYLEDGRRRFEGVADDGRAVEVVLQAGPCSDSADDGYATHFAVVRIDGAEMRGCGYEVSEYDRWSNYLMDYLPAIDVCLAEFSGRAQHVSLAYPLPGAATGVRLVDAGGRTWECATRDSDRAVNSLRPLDAADFIIGEGDPVFVRSALPAMGEGCYVYEAVRAADGALIGAFGFDGCGGGGETGS